MTGTDFSDELLMSFVDGEVDPRTAGRIEAAMRGDTGLAARIAVFAQTRALASDALEPLLDEPVPAPLVSSVQGMIRRHRQQRADRRAEVDPLRPRLRPPTPAQRWMAPLAASVAAVLAGLGGFWLGAQNGSQPQMLSLGTIGDPGLSDALASVPAGGERQIPELGRLRVISSFRDRNGGLCRELELNQSGETALGFVACRKEGAWTTTFAVATPGGGDTYAPASSADALDAYLSSIDASPPLTAAEEKQALEGLK